MTKSEWIIWFVIVGIIVLLLFLSCGCSSSIRWQSEPNEPVYTLTGKAAETMALAISQNALTASGRASAVLKYNGWLYVSLVVLLVGGLAFWGFTRSRYGFIIPSSAIGGIMFISFWAEYSQRVSLGVLAIAVIVLVWKAIEYHRERDAK